MVSEQTNTHIIILAAGKGSRMKSTIPKVMHKLAGEPLLSHVLRASATIPRAKKTVVIGEGKDLITAFFQKSPLAEDISFVIQAEQLGTAHAVQIATADIDEDSRVLVLYGDVPLIDPITIREMLNVLESCSLGVLTMEVFDPFGYGRILRDQDGNIEGIVEQKDATPDQEKILEVNTGVMAIKGAKLRRWLSKIEKNNVQGEYYLTDLVSLARRDKEEIRSIRPQSVEEIEGVNNRLQLATLERRYQLKLAEKLCLGGTSLADPSRFDQRGELIAGCDTFIDVNCLFEGTVQLGSGVHIGPNCSIKDTTIADQAIVLANSVIEQSSIGSGAVVGPFARLRAGTDLAENSKVGNFVETKKTAVGKSSKINHLSYVGDAHLGDNVNIGAGTITCNYDGDKKHATQVEDNVFIGSNSTLVAPVRLSKGAFIAAGSTITKTVGDHTLGIGRAKQRNISSWTSPAKKAQED
jgi:bifunctional UDP-N-acetylglucosamine pyrophosphorylase/glucosamine-1-phosphate N-acetyltransferase